MVWSEEREAAIESFVRFVFAIFIQYCDKAVEHCTCSVSGTCCAAQKLCSSLQVVG